MKDYFNWNRLYVEKLSSSGDCAGETKTVIRKDLEIVVEKTVYHGKKMRFFMSSRAEFITCGVSGGENRISHDGDSYDSGGTCEEMRTALGVFISFGDPSSVLRGTMCEGAIDLRVKV